MSSESSQWKALWLSYWKHVFLVAASGYQTLKLPGWIFRCMPCCTSPEMVPTGSSPLRSCPIFLSRSPQSCSVIIYLFNLCLLWGKWDTGNSLLEDKSSNGTWVNGVLANPMVAASSCAPKKKLIASSHLKMEGLDYYCTRFLLGACLFSGAENFLLVSGFG